MNRVIIGIVVWLLCTQSLEAQQEPIRFQDDDFDFTFIYSDIWSFMGTVRQPIGNVITMANGSEAVLALVAINESSAYLFESAINDATAADEIFTTILENINNSSASSVNESAIEYRLNSLQYLDSGGFEMIYSPYLGVMNPGNYGVREGAIYLARHIQSNSYFLLLLSTDGTDYSVYHDTLVSMILSISWNDPSQLWRDQAAALIAISGNDETPSGVQRVQRIAQVYADIYRRNQHAFKWAGLAALVSCEIHNSLTSELNQLLELLLTNAGGLPLDTVKIWWMGLGRDIEDPIALRVLAMVGNKAVYDDLLWQHLAYEAQGLDELETAYQASIIPLDVIEAWRLIDEGIQQEQEDQVWTGNLALLQYEQSITLQRAIYDEWLPLWNNIEMLPPWSFSSPIPEHSSNFIWWRGDFGNFEDRWRWMSEEILPAWRQFDENPTNRTIYESSLRDTCGVN